MITIDPRIIIEAKDRRQYEMMRDRIECALGCSIEIVGKYGITRGIL